ncbi:MAG: ATP-binding cassette domain-containing protein, partial [Methanobrevibacter sp.]|nr:ATP-binding cassette domain-containing protein [Methanobrevibacter sp.]
MKYAIETKNLTKMYKKFTAVNSLNLTVPNKSIFGMLGPNGAGKTTTIKMLTCLIQATSGTATVGGYDIYKNPNEVRNLLGMVPQQVSLYKDLTVQENSELCADFYGVSPNEKFDRINDLMELVDIKYAKDKKVGQLSGGQKQKASLVASLVHRPDILFLDEPTIGLDPTTKRILWDLIRDLNDSGHTIILCSHDMHEVDMLCDNVGIINTGTLVAYDTPQGLKDTLLIDQKEEYEKNINIALNSILEENSKDNDLKENLKENTKDINLKSSYKDNKLKESPKNNNLNDSNLKNLNLKEMSLIIENIDKNILNKIKENQKVHELDLGKNSRINLKINNFDDDAVNDVIKSIVDNGGIISSISTQEPSLEDV